MIKAQATWNVGRSNPRSHEGGFQDQANAVFHDMSRADGELCNKTLERHEKRDTADGHGPVSCNHLKVLLQDEYQDECGTAGSFHVV